MYGYAQPRIQRPAQHLMATYVHYQSVHQVYLITLVLKPQTELTSLMTLQLVKAVLEAQQQHPHLWIKHPKDRRLNVMTNHSEL